MIGFIVSYLDVSVGFIYSIEIYTRYASGSWSFDYTEGMNPQDFFGRQSVSTRKRNTVNYKNWSKVSVFNKLSNSKVNEKMAVGQINERKIVCKRYFERRNAVSDVTTERMIMNNVCARDAIRTRDQRASSLW